MSVMPARTRFKMCQTMSGRPRTFSSGFGQLSVRGRMRSPRLAAKIMAFMMLSLEGITDLRRAIVQFVHESYQWREFAVAAGGFAGVFHDQRHVVEVTVLAIAVIETSEDAQHFKMALHAHEFEITIEAVDIGIDGQAGFLCAFPVTDRPVEYQFFVPLNIGVA